MEWFAAFFSEHIGEAYLPVVCGLTVGLLFGASAQHSRFCLRSAAIEFWRLRPGPKFAIWLITFAAALLATQWQFANGSLEAASIRQLATTGSLSGAVIGGCLFGAGMILARGCASRLLVLSATGNLRALVAGLVLTITAQASLTGALSPLRVSLARLWPVSAEGRDLALHLPENAPLVLGFVLLALAVFMAYGSRLSLVRSVTAAMVGLAVALGWYLTAWHASWSFELVPVKSISFTGPSTDTLMALVAQPSPSLTFDTGLVPGVFAGSLIAAFAARELRWQAFDADSGMMRYLAGAVMMGFGAMLAGGCAVGAGVTGGSVMALTAWVALLCMWLSAGLADALIDRKRELETQPQTASDLISVKARQMSAK